MRWPPPYLAREVVLVLQRLPVDVGILVPAEGGVGRWVKGDEVSRAGVQPRQWWCLPG